MATLFHIYQNGFGTPVAAEAVENASRVVAWHLNESRRFLGELALPIDWPMPRAWMPGSLDIAGETNGCGANTNRAAIWAERATRENYGRSCRARASGVGPDTLGQ